MLGVIGAAWLESERLSARCLLARQFHTTDSEGLGARVSFLGGVASDTASNSLMVAKTKAPSHLALPATLNVEKVVVRH